MMALENIKSRLAAHNVRLDEMATPKVPMVTTDEPQQVLAYHATGARPGHVR